METFSPLSSREGKKNSVAPDRRLVFRGHLLHVICFADLITCQ